MKTEAIEKEANEYEGRNACYIHVELPPDSEVYMQMMAGSEAKCAQAIYNLICQLCSENNRDPKVLLKFYMKALKKFGPHKAFAEE